MLRLSGDESSQYPKFPPAAHPGKKRPSRYKRVGLIGHAKPRLPGVGRPLYFLKYYIKLIAENVKIYLEPISCDAKVFLAVKLGKGR